MARQRIRPPWEYLHDASLPSLESYELSRLNHAANLRREISALMDQWIEDTTQALLARWVREDRALPRPAPATCAATRNDAAMGDLPFNDLPLAGEPSSPETRSLKPARRSMS